MLLPLRKDSTIASNVMTNRSRLPAARGERVVLSAAMFEITAMDGGK